MTLTILGPLLAAAAIFVIRRGAAPVALLGSAAGLAGALVALARAAGGTSLSATLPGLPGLPLRLVAEPLSALLSAVVAVVGLLVLVYAVGYIEEEGGKVRFFAGMSFFVAAMQALTLAGDWVMLLAAWELIGLSSYLLIGFWYGRPGIGAAATRAFLYTRTADIGLYVAIFVLIALSERDLKHLLAASTSNQYGFMLLAVGAGSPVAALVHLVTHAAMKSSLFLGSGVFQHARGSTNFADLGGVGRERRCTFLGFAVAGLALAGVPPLSGFFSKDAILAASFESLLFAPLALACTLLSAAYVARALRLLWRGEGGGDPAAGTRWMSAGLVILAASLGLAVTPIGELLGDEVPEDTLAVMLGIVAAVAGLALGWLVPASRMLGPLRGTAERGFRLNGGFDGLVARPALAVARTSDGLERAIYTGVLGIGRAGLAVAHVTRLNDERGIDGLIFALVRGTRRLGGRARELQTGLVHRELLIAVAGGALILAFLVVGAIRF